MYPNRGTRTVASETYPLLLGAWSWWPDRPHPPGTESALLFKGYDEYRALNRVQGRTNRVRWLVDVGLPKD